MKAQDVVNLYQNMEALGATVWIDGGWCVDALLERVTRPHLDLDIALQVKDEAVVKSYLLSQGYKDMLRDDTSTWNYVLRDGQGRIVDLHIIEFDAEGRGVLGPKEENSFYPKGALSGIGKIEGKEVRCVAPKFMVEFLAPWIHKWPEKYVPAVSALCEKFNLELPKEYTDYVK